MRDKSESLYSPDDKVVVLHDGNFIGTQSKISSDAFKGPGVLKAYATWCPHCQSKVRDLNNLAEALEEFGLAIYAVEMEQNPIFADSFSHVVRGYPTFLQVNNNGEIGGSVLDEQNEEVRTIEGIVNALCRKDSEVCSIDLK